MVRTVHCHVITNVMVVTTITVPVIKGVNQVGGETTVNNVMYYHYSIVNHFFWIHLLNTLRLDNDTISMCLSYSQN